MSYIWLFFLGASLVCGVLTDQVSGLSGAAMQGAQQGAELCLSLCGALCLWSGAARVMEKSGLMQKLSCVLSPFLSRMQLLPTTVAALRAGLGADSPFEILPAVWVSSVCSVAVGLLAAALLEDAA